VDSLGNETASTYAPGNLTKTTAFKVSATGLLGCAADFSAPSTITVYPAFAAGAFVPDAGGTVCVNGTPGTITSTIQQTAPAGSGSYTYAWYRNGNTGTSVSTGEYFTPPSETATGAVTYTRKVFDASCASNAGMTAGSYILQVEETPTVSLTAVSTTICHNTPAVIATTAPVDNETSYTWDSSTDGLAWSGATVTTPSSLTTGNLTAKTFYAVTVTVNDAACPVAISAAPATITVRDAFNPGAITSATYTICVGGTPEQITGNAASGGDEVMTYKWTYSYNGNASVDITNSNAKDYTPSTEVTTNGAGTYHYQRWAIDGACQSTYTVATNTYTLVVVADPTMNNISVSGPGTATICNNTAGGTLTAKLSSAAVGGPYTYAWQKWEAGAATWTAIVESADTYAPGDLTDTTAFRVSATGSSGCAADFSAPSTITVYPAFAAGAFVSDAGGTVCINGTPGTITNAIQDAAPAGSGNYMYEWYKNGDATPVSTDEYFTPSSETVPGAVTYTRKVFDKSCAGDAGMTAGSYILQVKPTPTVSLTAVSTTICHNTPAVIATTAPVDNETSYAWYSSTDGLTWSGATVTTPSSLTTGNLTTKTFYAVTVTVNDAACPVAISDAPATITVRDAFNPGAITSDTYTICVGGTPVQITGTAASGGDGAMTYKWTYSYNGNASVDITNNNQNYTPSTEVTTNGAGTYHYQRWAKDGACESDYTVAANTYTLVVLPAPSVTITPATQVICFGTTATFTVNVTNDAGGAATCTWEQKKATDAGWSNAGKVYSNTFTSGAISEETAFRVTWAQPGSACTSVVSTPATVTLNQEQPVYTAPSDITAPTGAGVCTATLTHNDADVILQGAYAATCPLDSLYYTITGATVHTGAKISKVNPLTTHAFNKGVSVVTYTVKNALGLSSSSSFTVTVTDNQPPVITCQNGDVYLDATGHAVIDVSALIASASDNCDAALVYETNPLSAASFTCTDLGEKGVEVRAKDVSGNYSLTCAATVTVHNDQPPVAVCKPKDTVYVSVDNGLLEASRLAAASSTSNCKQSLEYYILSSDTDISSTHTSKTFACTEGGTTYTVYVGVVNTANLKMAVCSAEVLVTDTVLQCTAKGIDTLYLPDSACSYTLTPAIDGDLIPMSVATPYRGCQNTLKPVAGMELVNNKGFNIYATPFPDTKFGVGVHEITWTLRDAFGDRATCKDVFAVVDTIRPVFTTTLSSLDRYLSPGSCTVSVSWSLPEVTDNCTGWTRHRTDVLGGTSSLDLAAGAYLIQYVAEDAAGNVSKDTSKIFITVLDQNNPDIAAIADTIMQVNNATDCFATVPAGGLRPVISNVCLTGSTLTYTTNHAGAMTGPVTTTVADGLGGVQFNVGATAVTYTVTAANGNSGTGSFTVNVQDTVKPKITCKSDLSRLYDSNGEYKVSGDELDVTVAPKCVGTPNLLATIDGDATTTYSTLKDYIFSGASSFVIQWKATDASNNTSACSFTLTMNDTIRPVFTSFPDTVRVNTDPTDCAATVDATRLAATYKDNVTSVADIAVVHKIAYKGSETSGNGLLPQTIFRHDTTKVTYTITDKAGNSRNSSFLVIVIDSVPPLLTCPTNITGLQIAHPSTACVALSTALASSTYSDNCGAVKTLSWSVTGSRGAKDTSGAADINKLTTYSFAAGTNTVRYTAADSSGNTATCSFTVEVADKVDPVCQSVSTYTLKLQNTSTTTLDASWLDNGSTDNCGTLTYTLSNPAQATFECSDIGKKRNVYLKVSDDFGNVATCVATEISVADTIVPVVHCQDVTVYLDAQASASLTAVDLETSAADNCTASGQLQRFILRADGITVTPDTTFDCTAAGQTYTLTVRVLDESGNAGTCTSVVTVRDTLLAHRGKVTIPANPDACVATLSDTLDPEIVSGCSAATLTSDRNSADTYAGMELPIGTNYVTWTLDDGKGTKTVEDTIIVEDKQKPVLRRTVLTATLNKGVVSGCAASAAVWMEPGVYINSKDTLAKDNCTDARDLTWERVDTNQTRVVNGSGTVPVGRWIIQYTAKDAAGNESDTLSFFVVVNNNEVPAITCPGGAEGKDTIFVASSACAATVPARFASTVTGLCPGADSLSYAYTFNGGVDVTKGTGSLEGSALPVGLYSVTYTATNKFASSPATASCTFTLAVRDTIKPVFTCPNDQSRDPETLYYTVNGDEFDLTNVSDNCGVASITHDFGSGGTTTLANVQIPAGATPTITWKVVDIHGNADSCKFVLTIGDKVKPDVTVNETPAVYLDDTGNGVLLKDSVIIHMRDNATDSSAIATTLTRENFTCADIGSGVPGTFTATDLAGNATIKAITVTVLDTIAPTFTLRNPTVYLNAAGAGVLTMDSVIVALRDNCTPRASLDTSLNRTSFTCSDIALSPITVTFTAEDAHGNMRSRDVAVTVTDTVKPEITCAAGMLTRSTRATDCNYEVNADEFNPAVTDVCGSYTLVHNYSGGGATLAGALLPAGTHAITWKVTNLSGNTATCEVTVEVKDETPPVFTACPPSITEIILTSGCTATASIGTPLYVDNCMIDSLTWSIRSAGILRDFSDGTAAISTIPANYPFPAGTNVITYIVTDTSGNRAACTFTVPVKETVAPVCAGVATYILKLQGPGVTTLDPKKLDNGSSDNCTAFAVSFDLASGSPDFTCADIDKPRTVYLRVTDVSGNKRTCTTPTIITVIDTIAPEARCVTGTTLYVDSNGEISLSAAALNTNSTDNCSPALTYSFRRIVAADTTYAADTTFKCAGLGMFNVTVAVADAYTNRGTCTVQVTVKDTLKPVITFSRPQRDTVSTDNTSCKATLSAALDPKIEAGSACQTISTVERIVDGGAPVTTGTYAGLQLQAGSHTIAWKATSGTLITEVVDTIVVVDRVAPVVIGQMQPQNETASNTCESENPVSWPLPENYTTPNTLVEDNCTASSALTWTRVDANQDEVKYGQTAPAGVWKIQYVATDEAGNTSDTVGFVLTVVKLATPGLSDCPSGVVTLDIDAADVCYATAPATFTPTTTGFGGCANVDSLAYKITGALTEEGEGSLAGRQLQVGSYSATYTVFNRTNLSQSDQSATCAFDVVVRDTAAPVVTCVADTSLAVNNAGDNIVITAQALVVSVTDCTPTAALTYNFDTAGMQMSVTYTKNNVGQTYPHTIYVTDESNNKGLCTVNVTIIDTIPPAFDLRNPVNVYLDNTGHGTLLRDSVIIHMSDNVTDSINIVTGLSPHTFTCADAGTSVTVTFTAKDGYNNDSTQTITVHVRDTIKPVVTCEPDKKIAINAAGDPVILTAESLVMATSSFCAANAPLTYSFSNSAAEPEKIYNCGTLGAYPLTIYVTDFNDNKASCTVTVTVQDNIPPELVCDGSFATISINGPGCDTTITGSAMDFVQASDNTVCRTLTNDKNGLSTLAGATFAIGTHTVVWTVTDAGSHTATCDMPLRVLDNHPPDVVCKSDTTLLALGEAGTVTVKAEELLKSKSDCSPLTYTFASGRNTYNCDDIGTYTLTVKVTDAYNNSSACNVQVQVKDTLPPQLTVNNPVTVKVGETLTPDQVIIASLFGDNCTPEAYMHDPANGLIRFEPNTPFTCTDVGASSAGTVYVKDAAGNEASATFTVQVEPMKPAYKPLKDTTVNLCSPNDTLPANSGEITSTPADVTVCGSAPATITYTNSSNQGPDKTQREYYNYTIKRTWRVSAGPGNDSITVQTITVQDTLKPVVKTEDALTVYLDEYGKGAPDPGKALRSVSDCAADSVDITIQYSVPEFDCSHIGTPQTVTVTGTDPSVNVSEPATITITVLDTLPPVVTAHDAELLLDASGAATLTQSLVLATLRDNCTDSSDIKVSFTRYVFHAADMENPIPVWVYVEDARGNKDSAQVQITVIDDVPRETAITKRIEGRDVANIGDTVTFVIKVTNEFGGDRNLILVDSLPDGLKAVDIPGNSSVDFTGRVVTINHGALAAEASVEYRIKAVVTQTGEYVNHAYLYRQYINKAGYVDAAEASPLHATQPELVLTAKIREGDYTNTEVMSPGTYNVPGDYRLIVRLENTGGAMAARPIDVRIPYDPSVHRFAGSSRGGDIRDYGNLIVWTVTDLNNGQYEDLELTFVPLIAYVYTFHIGTDNFLPNEDPSNNSTTVVVNQAIVNVPNVLTSEHPELYIKELRNEAITEVTVSVVNTWGNQVYYTRRRKDDINDRTCWFNAANLARGTYWYELTIRYDQNRTYVIRDYVEVLK
jgi:fimbrial isopeptide formation D2 family protein/uncharacterized repeat protein (TIGR01451 family)